MKSSRSQQSQVAVVYRKEKDEIERRVIYIGTEDGLGE